MGVIIYEAANKYIKPFGTIFLNLIKFIVVPIVLFSIMCGIISMKDVRKVGSIGLKTVVYYMCTTAVAIVIGLVGGNLFRGMFPVIATTDLAYEAAESTSLMDTIVNIFPSNFISPMVSHQKPRNDRQNQRDENLRGKRKFFLFLGALNRICHCLRGGEECDGGQCF